MKPEEWNQIDELFQKALNEAPGDRAAFLDRACDGKEVTRREVESLLAHHDQAQGFLEQPPSEIAAELLTSGRSQFLKGQFISHYRVTECLGAGGMGEVYLARDTRLNRPVAIKVLLSPFTSDSHKVQRFEQEARAASALNHPNIVTIHEVGQVNGAQYIVAEYIEGQTLSQRLTRSGPMNVGEALDVAMQIANALDAAHAAGIVHRDIKPDNVMLRPDGLVKVLDFGLAKLFEPATFISGPEASDKRSLRTNPGMVMGTARYMSPEQARGQNVDARTDIWSLGVVFFEMLTGKSPFDGETPSHVIVNLLDEPAPSLSAHVKDIPPALERIVNKSLCKNIDERYRTTTEFADDLKNLRVQLQDSGRLNQSMTAVANRPLPNFRNWWRRGAIAAVTAIVLAAGVFPFLARPDKPIHSVAIVPFANNGDAATEYLSNAISETLVNSLSQIPQLRVAPRSMAYRYKDENVDARTIGRELGVRAVLTGRVASRGDGVEIQVDLLDTESMSELLRATYSRRLIDLLDAQKELAAAVVSKLGLQSRASKYDTNSNEAYQLYLQGRYYWQKYSRSLDGDLKMGDYFQKAIAIDPNYSLAYAGLADYYATMGLLGRMPGAQSWPKSEEAAVKALALDESVGEAHHSLAAVRIWYDHNWREAERELQRAIELKPDFAEGYTLYARLLDATGRVDEAIAAAKRSWEVDPHMPHRRAPLLGGYYFHARRYDLAAEEFRKSVENDPGDPNAHIGLGRVYVQQKKLAQALAEARKAKALVHDARLLAYLGGLFAAAGDTEEATKILVEAKTLASKRPYLAHSIASIYAGLGNNTEAIIWLTKSVDEFDAFVIELKVDPRFDTLRQDPRFAAVLGRLKLLQ